jgi:endonuclease/exonuclease/phosphatase (EEP) superfamily protein YafD
MANKPEGAALPMWLRLARLYIGGVGVVVALIWLGLSYGPEFKPLLALMQYVPYPAYLLPALLAVLLSVVCGGWWWRIWAAASLLVVLVPIMGLCTGSPDEGHGRVRLMSYNIKAYLALQSKEGPSRLALEVIQHDPDVLVMQDAGQILDLKESNPAVLKTLLGDRQVYSFGQYVVASRFPLTNCAPGWMPYRGEQHSFVHCVMTAHEQEVDLFTVHFVTPREGLNATRHQGLDGLSAWHENMAMRMMQSGLMAEQLRAVKRPFIVAGDLNAPESSLVIQTLLHTGLRDAYSSAAWGYGYTHGHSLWPGITFLRIDHILVSDQIGVAHVEVGGAVASQHRPVIADLLMHRQ